MGAYCRLQVMCPRLSLAHKVFSALSTHKGDSGRMILAAILLTPGKVGILEFHPVSSSSLLLLFYIRNAGGCLGLFPLCLFIGQSSYTSVSFVGSGQLCNLIFRL